MRMQNKLGAAILAMALLGAGAVPATAQKSADTLRIVMRDALPNIDPYYNNLRTGVVMHHQGWDALVYRNPVMSGRLAESILQGKSVVR